MIEKLLHRARTRPVVATLTVLGLTLLIAGGYAGVRLWYGTPYPAVDPTAVDRRLQQYSQQTYDALGLPKARRTTTLATRRTDTGACSYRGLRAFAHIDRPQRGVISFSLSWQAPDVPEAQARQAQQQLRQRLTAEGWRTVNDWNRQVRPHRVELGYRFEAPKGADQIGEDQINVQWNSTNTTLLIDIYAPCGRTPDGYDPLRSEHDPAAFVTSGPASPALRVAQG
jgi:hypothetical protein